MFASTYIKTQGYIRGGAETSRHLSMYKYLGTISSGQTTVRSKVKTHT